MARLPVPGSDNGTWGDILNDFLTQEHNADGTLKVRSDGTLTNLPVGGDLSGTVSNAQIASGVVGDAEIAAAIKDPVAGTAGLRTLGTGAQQAAAGNDTRLSDARTPLAHAPTHVPGGTDSIDYSQVNLVGTLAGRPAAAAANNGLLYLATDDVGGTFYRSNGSAWVKVGASVLETGGRELAYVEITSNYTRAVPGGDVSFADVPGLAVTPTVGLRPIMVEFSCSAISHSLANGTMQVGIFEGATQVGATYVTGNVAGSFSGAAIFRRLAPSAGSYTYKISVNSAFGSAGTLTLVASVQQPASIRVREL